MKIDSYELRLAKLVLRYSLNIVKGDIVLIKAETSTEPLVREFCREILKLGAHPVLRLFLPDTKELLAKHGDTDQLSFLPDFEILQTKKITAYIYIDSSVNTKSLTNCDPKKLATIQKTALPLRDIMNKREADGIFRWCICPYPSHAMAQDADMSFDEYQSFVYDACKLNDPNPVKSWQKVDKEQDKIIKILENSKDLHIIGKNTDLQLSVANRLWRKCSGQRNMPDGEVFTSPVENSATGKIFFDIPTTYNGVEAEDVTLTFQDGIVVEATAKKGEKFLHKMLEMDEGARKVGEIAFGLNDNIRNASKNILFDEKIGRSMHLAIGASYEETGGKNRSALHWDLIKNMRNTNKVFLDGKLIYENGRFK